MPIFDFDRRFDWDEYQRELADPTNIPIIGPYIGYSRGEFIPSYSEESLASMATHAFSLWMLGLSVRLAAASILMSRPLTLGTVTIGSAAGWISTADVHGAVPPGVSSGFGIPMGPATGGSVENPIGLTPQSLSDWWDRLW